jgi:hypothetical protein
MGKPIGQFPVIGHQDQTFAFKIQTSNGKEMPGNRDQVTHTGTRIIRIAVRKDVAGFIQGYIKSVWLFL